MTNRELDALVAEHVMGLELERDCLQCSGTGYIDQDRCHVCHYSLNNVGKEITTPKRYSTDIAAAWEVLHRFETFTVDASSNADHEYGYCVHINDLSDTFADTAPKAICLAALKAVGVEVR